jgi:hypothetical protein
MIAMRTGVALLLSLVLAAPMLVADALIKANKHFDLLLLPNANHGYGTASNYMMRRRWDYFVKWLGIEPTKEWLPR